MEVEIKEFSFCMGKFVTYDDHVCIVTAMQRERDMLVEVLEKVANSPMRYLDWMDDVGAALAKTKGRE